MQKGEYKTGYALTVRELFTGFKVQKLKAAEGLSSLQVLELIPIICRMFKYLFFLILTDIIENNVTFKFPNKTRCYMEMASVHGDDFIRARQNGAFQDIDFLASNFTGNSIQFRRVTRYGKWVKKIYVGNIFKDRIREHTHNRKQYG